MQTFDEIKQNSQVIYPHSLLLLVTTMKMLKIVLLVTIFLPWNEDSTEDVICGEMCISMRSEEIVGLEWREISLYSVIWSEDGDHYIIAGNFLVGSYDWHFRVSRSRQEKSWKQFKISTIGTISTLHRPLATGVWWTAVAEPDNFSQVQLFEKLVTKTNLLRAKIRLGCRIPSYLIPIAVIRGHWCVLMVYN